MIFLIKKVMGNSKLELKNFKVGGFLRRVGVRYGSFLYFSVLRRIFKKRWGRGSRF